MIAIVCMSAFVMSGRCCGVQSLWLTISMVINCKSSLILENIHKNVFLTKSCGTYGN